MRLEGGVLIILDKFYSLRSKIYKIMAKAVIIYGPPGSGKGTQAELLTKRFNFIHFDTGRYIESVLSSPAAAKDKILRKEKKLFESGKLNTPAWVLKIVSEAAKRFGTLKYNIVFSGSPRTFFEAFGDPEGASKKQSGLMKLLEKLYNKKNILVVEIDVKPQTSIFRNSNRRLCSVCGLPFLASAKISSCPFCAAPPRRRILDNPEIIKVRLQEYKNRTYPIIKELKRLRYLIARINGEQPPYLVHNNIVKKISL